MRLCQVLSCLVAFAFVSQIAAQTPPTAYTIVENVASPPIGSTVTIQRNGNMVLWDAYRPADGATPASHSFTLSNIAQGKNWSWNPGDASVPCNAGRFSGDWGDPFSMTADLLKGIADGTFKPAGTDTISGIVTRVYSGVTNGETVKAWLDPGHGLVLRALFGASPTALQPLIDITKVSFEPPPASVFRIPAVCAGVKAPPTAAELISAETGDDSANYVNAVYGPGSKNSCSIVIRVVAAKTMAPVTRKWQAAIDTTFDQNHPAPYTFGVGVDGTASFSGGGIHEITSQIHNDMLRIDNPPAYFNLAMNVIQPNHGTATALIYKQCFAPVTMLYYVLKDPNDPGQGGDYLYAKSGKYAAVPTH